MDLRRDLISNLRAKARISRCQTTAVGSFAMTTITIGRSLFRWVYHHSTSTNCQNPENLTYPDREKGRMGTK